MKIFFANNPSRLFTAWSQLQRGQSQKTVKSS
jgi:hypothetical protein